MLDSVDGSQGDNFGHKSDYTWVSMGLKRLVDMFHPFSEILRWHWSICLKIAVVLNQMSHNHFPVDVELVLARRLLPLSLLPDSWASK